MGLAMIVFDLLKSLGLSVLQSLIWPGSRQTAVPELARCRSDGNSPAPIPAQWPRTIHPKI
jgi:hypothetical protein